MKNIYSRCVHARMGQLFCTIERCRRTKCFVSTKNGVCIVVFLRIVSKFKVNLVALDSKYRKKNLITLILGNAVAQCLIEEVYIFIYRIEISSIGFDIPGLVSYKLFQHLSVMSERTLFI